jgi:hypothetical protein
VLENLVAVMHQAYVLTECMKTDPNAETILRHDFLLFKHDWISLRVKVISCG